MSDKLRKELQLTAQNIKESAKHSPAFWVCLIISVALLVTGFFLPPIGVIDNSVLTAGGILFGFGCLGVVDNTVAKGGSGKITKGDTTIEIENKQE